MADPTNVQQLAEQLLDDASLDPDPELLPVPATVRGFGVRLDLRGARPPIWRRLELPGDLTLPRLHDVIQAAMGWTDSHLHQFRTGADSRSPRFLTEFDLSEGEEGLLEDGVRLDQLVAAVGDRLWYAYDFGDGWDHVLAVESVLDQPPDQPRCTAGRMACPPEDCGGLYSYQELADWVRGSYDEDLLPDGFESAAHGRGWLPVDWHPDQFDLDQTNADLAVAAREPITVTGELAELADQLDRRGIRTLRQTLARPDFLAAGEVTGADAERLTDPYRVLLEVIGDGVRLTNAGYLPPSVVEQLADRSGITRWWIGKANREDLTPPVADIRETARMLGLVSVRKGRLAPTTAGVRVRSEPLALWQHVVKRLPLGSKDIDRQAGWMALAVVGSGTPADEWRHEISELLFLLGWRSGGNHSAHPFPHSPTLTALELLGGVSRTGWWLEQTDAAVAETARAVIRG